MVMIVVMVYVRSCTYQQVQDFFRSSGFREHFGSQGFGGWSFRENDEIVEPGTPSEIKFLRETAVEGVGAGNHHQWFGKGFDFGQTVTHPHFPEKPQSKHTIKKSHQQATPTQLPQHHHYQPSVPSHMIFFFTYLNSKGFNLLLSNALMTAALIHSS